MNMPEIHYGVVRQDGVWVILGRGLRFGRYRTRQAAVSAARRLADSSAGLAVRLHVQGDDGELPPPVAL